MSGLLPDTPEQLAFRMGAGLTLPPVCMSTEGEARFASPPAWIKTEQQGMMNSCAGNAGSTLLEKLQFMLTKSQRQLSRLFMYVEGQKASGDVGYDNGCRLFGIIRAAQQIGCCGEDVVPYGPYRTRFPAEAYEDAKKIRAKTTINPRNYADWRAILGQNIGGLLIGMQWPIRLQNGYAAHYQPTGGDGHALAALFLADTEDSQGRPDVLVANSHGPDFGINGWMKVSASFVDELQAQDPFGNQGVTDLVDIAPRKFSWADDSAF